MLGTKFMTFLGLLSILSSISLATAKVQSELHNTHTNSQPIHPVRALRRDPRQQGLDFGGDFVITFSADGTPIKLLPIKLKLSPIIASDLSNNGRVILGSAFADFLKDELSNEWATNTDIADLMGVQMDVVSVEGNNKNKEIETTLDTTLRFDGLDDPPSYSVVTEAVCKALKNTDKFILDHLVPSGLAEFSEIKQAEVSCKGDEDEDDKKPPKGDDSDKDTDKEDDDKPKGPGSIAKANEQLDGGINETKILIPASILGLAMFALTAFFIAQRSRKNNLDESFDSMYDDDVDHTVNGSHVGKEEIEVRAGALGSDYGGGYSSPDRNGLNTSFGAGHTAMHMPAMEASMTDSQLDNMFNMPISPARSPKGGGLYNRGSVIDQPSARDASSMGTSEYSSGNNYR